MTLDELKAVNKAEETPAVTMHQLGWVFIAVCVLLLILGVWMDPTMSSGYSDRVFNLHAGLRKLTILLGGMASGIAGLLLLIGDAIIDTLRQGGKPPVKELNFWEKDEVMPEDEEDKDDGAPELKTV
jgi:hypothetical protein